MNSFDDRLKQVNERIANACQRIGRDVDSVSLVAVSKYHPPEMIEEAYGVGLRIFGESRVQEAAQKIPLCSPGCDWHFIGHLQRNKVAKAVPLFSMIHSVDSVRLLDAIQQAASDVGEVIRVCIEVNVSGELSKNGIAPEDLQALLEHACTLHAVDIVGLMTMAPWSEDVEEARPVFSALRDLRDRCANEWGFPLEELSMGMSNDFEVAIEEGATYIRVGTDLFGPR